MVDLDPRALPNPEETSGPVREDVKPEAPVQTTVEPEQDDAIHEEPVREPQKAQNVEPGSKTPDANLRAALLEERKKRKEATDRAEALQQMLEGGPSVTSFANNRPSDSYIPDDGKAIHRHISNLESEVRKLREEKDLEVLYSQYPALRGRSDDFRKFRDEEFPGSSLDRAAKLFLVENDLWEGSARPGLEAPTGGSKEPTSGIAVDDVRRLRETNYRKYEKLLREGKIRGEDIR